MKAELEGIVHGLQTYLSDVQHKADCQRSNFDALVREKAELSECLRDLEADASKTAEHQAGEVSLLREVGDLCMTSVWLLHNCVVLASCIVGRFAGG